MLRIKNDLIQNSGVYICTVFSWFGTMQNTSSQSADYQLHISAGPRFTSTNAPEHYIYPNRKNELNMYYVANPIANITLLKNNNPQLNFNRCDISVSVTKAKVLDYIYDKIVSVNGYQINIQMLIGKRLDFSNITVLLQNDRGVSYYTVLFIAARPRRAPENIKFIALETELIVTWRAKTDIVLRETVFVEYRTYLEFSWCTVYVQGKSMIIIDGLEPDTIYFLRIYTKTANGESNRTDEMIVKTAFKKRKHCFRHQVRVPQSVRTEEQSVRLHDYDEINSIYYNPTNVIISPQNTINNVQIEIQQPSISSSSLENNDNNQHITHSTIHQIISSHGISTRSSSDESYLIPSRQSINPETDIVKEDHETIIDETAIPVEGSSISSDNSETNIKHIRKYETLNVTDSNEHYYKEYKRCST